MAKAKKSKAKKSKAKKSKAKKGKQAVKAKAKSKKSKKTSRTAAKAATARKAPVKKTAKRKQIVGEGDYAASRSFLKDQSGFVKRNRTKIPALAKAAEAALEGPEGASLRAAEEEAKGHSRSGSEP